jgi:hypothetical protein
MVAIAVVWSEDDVMPLSFVFQFLLRPPIYHAVWWFTCDHAYADWIDTPPAVIIVKRTVQLRDDGVLLCQRIRTTPQLIQVPIILGWIDSPGNPDERRTTIAQDVGANGSFGRVYNIEGVQAMIVRLLHDPTAHGLRDQ